MLKITVLSVHSGIRHHALPESYLIKELQNHSIQISYVTCGETFSEFCHVMPDSILSLPKAKKKVCNYCNKCADVITNHIGSVSHVLKDHLVDDDYFDINQIMQDIDRHNCQDFVFKGVEVGKIALYELILRYKKMTLEISEAEWPLYQIYFKNCVLSLLSFSRIYEIDNPDFLMVYSPQYAVNGVCAEYMMAKNKKVFFIEGSSSNSERYKALRVWDWSVFGLTNPALKYWESKKYNINKDSLKRVVGHFQELLCAESYAVYSPPMSSEKINVRQNFKIPHNKKIILASLSSFDEAFSAYVIGKFPEEKVNSTVFKNQFFWIKRTIELFKDREDVFIIIRLHPRDFPNKRESQQAEQAKIWMEVMKDLPPNMVCNYPQENISIYDLFKAVDVVITGWSATGVEALAFGIPVVTYDKNLPSYPQDIHLTGDTEQDYIQNINKALDDGINKKNTINALSWLAFNFSLGTIQTPELFFLKKNFTTFMKIFMKVVNKLPLKIMMKYELSKKITNKEDVAKLITMLKNGHDSLFEQLPKKVESEVNTNIENEFVNFIKKVRNNE